jgi:AcrR family transcriptional regulator
MSEAAIVRQGDAVGRINDGPAGEVVHRDGRNRRAIETRRKVIAAAKAMIAETSAAPTVVAVAKRADVSVRSVFQHFGDVESLFVTVLDSSLEELAAPEAPPSGQPLAARIDMIVQNMAEVFDKVVPLRVAAGQFVGHPGLLARAATSRQRLRDAAMTMFAPEFAILSEQTGEELADAIGAALSPEAWIVLRRRDGLSVERAKAVWRRTLTALMLHGVGMAAADVAAE